MRMQMNKRYADEIHSALVSGIVDGRYQPGDVLNEIPIAEEFGVSRTPVREALQRLSTGGLVERGPRRAVIVRKMTRESLHRCSRRWASSRPSSRVSPRCG